MRLPAFASACLASSLLATASAQSLAGSTASASTNLIALTPITAAWLNAPAGTPGAVVAHPAGLVTNVNVAAPIGTAWANFLCNVAAAPDHVVMTATSLVFAPPGEIVQTQADLLLSISAPPNLLGTIDLGVAHFGDMPAPEGFEIDFGNDGVDDLDTAGQYCCGTLQRRVLSRPFANGPWLVRIRNDNTLAASPQAYDLRLDFRLQLAGVTDLGSDCGQPITTPPTTLVYSTNSRLVALPSPVAGEFGVLRAVGLGHLALFLFADQGSLVPLPLPPFGSCDLLANPLFGVQGNVTSGTSVPSEWEVHLPALPAGFTFHAQHAWLNLNAPMQLGASNVLRIDT